MFALSHLLQGIVYGSLYVVVCLTPIVVLGLTVLRAKQGDLVFPRKHTLLPPAELARLAAELGAEPIEVQVDEDVTLRGLLLPALDDRPDPRPLVVYFGGNGEPVLTTRANDLRAVREAGFHLAFVPYRGYGASDGVPTAEHVQQDAAKTCHVLAQHPAVDAGRMFAWGRSIGTGIAAHVATSRELAGVVLTSPYTRLSDVAARRYPLLPVRRFFQHEIDTLASARLAGTAALILHGDQDDVIPLEQGRRVQNAWEGGAELVRLPGRGHHGLSKDPDYVREVVRFLRVQAGMSPEAGEDFDGREASA